MAGYVHGTGVYHGKTSGKCPVCVVHGACMCGWCHCQEHGQGQQFKMGSRRKEVTPKPVEEEELEEVEVEEED